MNASSFTVHQIFAKHVSHSWHRVLDTCVSATSCTQSSLIRPSHGIWTESGSSRTWDHHSECHSLEILTLRAGLIVAEPARELVPDWAGLSNTLERFEEDALIYFHSGPQESEGSGLGPALLQQFPRAQHSERSDWNCSRPTMAPTGCSNSPTYILAQT